MKITLCLLLFLQISSLVLSVFLQSRSFSVIHSLLKAKQTKKEITKKTTSKSKAVNKNSINKSDTIKSKKKKGASSASTIIKDTLVTKESSISPSHQLLEKLLPFVTPLCLAASMLITWKVNFEDKKLLFLARATFAIYMIVSQLLVMFLEKKINALDDQTLVIEKPAINPLAPTAITTTAAASVPSSTSDSSETIASPILDETATNDALTAKEYDLRQLRAYSSSLLMEGCMSGYMHFFQKSIKSLIFCQFMGISNTLTNNLIKIHLFGMKAEGTMQRPFQSNMERMMADVLKKVQPPPPAAVDAADAVAITAGETTVSATSASDAAVPMDDEDDDEVDMAVSRLSMNLKSSKGTTAKTNNIDDNEEEEGEENSEKDEGSSDDEDDDKNKSTISDMNSSSTIAGDIKNAVNEALKDLTDSTSATSTSIFSSSSSEVENSLEGKEQENVESDDDDDGDSEESEQE